MILTANGALDTTFNTTGYKIYKFDTASDRPDESLYGAAVSPDGMFAAAAGYRNASQHAPASATTNDDAVLVILPLGGTGTEFAAVVPLSATTKDRFWAVTFDANNKVVAAGYVTDGNESWLAVARFNTDGTLERRSAPAASPRSTPAPAPRAPSSRRRAAWWCSPTARSSSADPRSTSLAGDVSISADCRRRAGDGRVWRRRSGGDTGRRPRRRRP